jgi:hypothetical protein
LEFQNRKGFEQLPREFTRYENYKKSPILSEKPTDGADQSVRRDEASTSVMQIAIRAQAAWILQAGRLMARPTCCTGVNFIN